MKGDIKPKGSNTVAESLKIKDFVQVLKSVMQLGGQLVVSTAAFSTSLIKGYDGKIKTDITVKAKMTEENYSDELKERLNSFKNCILGK